MPLVSLSQAKMNRENFIIVIFRLKMQSTKSFLYDAIHSSSLTGSTNALSGINDKNRIYFREHKTLNICTLSKYTFYRALGL